MAGKDFIPVSSKAGHQSFAVHKNGGRIPIHLICGIHRSHKMRVENHSKSMIPIAHVRHYFFPIEVWLMEGFTGARRIKKAVSSSIPSVAHMIRLSFEQLLLPGVLECLSVPRNFFLRIVSTLCVQLANIP